MVIAWGSDVPGLSTIQRWAREYESGLRTSVMDAPKTGRPSVVDDRTVDQINQVVVQILMHQ